MSDKNTNKPKDAASTEQAQAPIDYAAQPTSQAEPKKYIFGDYEDETRPRLGTDIDHLFTAGFDRTPWDFAWQLTANVHDASRRYYTICRKDLEHGRWFIPRAFAGDGCIYTGRIVKATGLPELILCVREVEAKIAEEQAMLRASKANREGGGDKAEALMESLTRTVHDSKGDVAVTTAIAGGIGWAAFGKPR